MTRVTVHEYAAALRPRYRAAQNRKEKKRILDEFCETTGLHRKAAIRLLNAECRPKAAVSGRPRRYGPEVVEPLRRIWDAGDRMCGKLLVAVLPDLLAGLERHGELRLRADIRELLLAMSASTIDRLLRQQSIRLSNVKPRHRVSAPQSVKQEVPVRTWSEWRDVKPGSLQADLVFHSGESLRGFHLTTLTAIDIATGWTELEPVWGLGMSRVGGAIGRIAGRLPFALTALHTDNGSEFINRGLSDWCQRHGIARTRGRPYKKNDQAWVEQRNWQSVRRHVGYERYSSKAAHELLGKLYPLLCLQMNFFRPVRKLMTKERHGARVIKRYDAPMTPYQRLLKAGSVEPGASQRIDRRLAALNPAELQRSIDRILHQLWNHIEREGGSLANVG